MSDNQNGPLDSRPEPIVIKPAPAVRRSRRGWVLGGALALTGVVAFGAVQAWSQSFGHGFGPRHHMMGGAPFDPVRMAERVDFGTDIILGRVGANDEQKKKVAELIKAQLKDIPALRDQHRAARDRIVELLKSEKIDRAELEKVRAQQLATADQMSRRIVDAVIQAGDILTPKQRQDLVSLWEKRPGWR